MALLRYYGWPLPGWKREADSSGRSIAVKIFLKIFAESHLQARGKEVIDKNSAIPQVGPSRSLPSELLMKTLTDAECSAWLDSRNLIPEPYGRFAEHSLLHRQFPLPKYPLTLTEIFRIIVREIAPFGAALLQVTDWGLYTPDQMAVVDHVRRASGESRPLITTPGHSFTSDEQDLLIGLFGLVTFYGWSAYLYLDSGVSVLSWEGDLLDLFDSERERHAGACKLIHELVSNFGDTPMAT